MLPWRPGSGRSPTVRTTSGPSLSFCSDKQVSISPSLPCGTMSERFELTLWELMSISSTAASPARTSALRVLGQAWRVSEAAFFTRLSAFPRSSLLALFSSKTFGQASRSSFPSSELNLSVLDSSAGMVTFRPPTSVPTTSASDGSSLLPTPSASAYGSSNNGCPGDGRESYRLKGKPSLETMARHDLWPTPRASPNENRQLKPSPSQLAGKHGWSLAAAVNHWPTPCARDSKGHAQIGRKNPRGFGDDSLPDRVTRYATPRASDGAKGGPNMSFSDGRKPLPAQVGGQLNPTWVEWLMGYPAEWTALEDWATQWFRSRRAARLKSLREGSICPTGSLE